MQEQNLRFNNVIWHTASIDSSGSMPLGNGDICLNVWAEANGDLLFYISKSDAWNENSRLLKLGRVRVNITPNPFAAEFDFSQVLKLYVGEIEINAGEPGSQVTLRLWVDANQPVINLEVACGHPIEVCVALENWRDQTRELVGREAASAYGLHGGPKPIIESADTICDEGSEKPRILWYHRNPSSIWADTLELQGLEALINQGDDPLAHRTFGAAIQGKGLVNESATVLKSEAPVTQQSIRIFPYTAQTATAAEWVAGLDNEIERVKKVDCAAALQAHRDWWHEFWNRSWINISGDEWDETVTRGYLLQRFITACAGRGAFPIKFNGSLFTVDAREEDENFDADYRRWGGPYWFQNTRLAYWPMLAAGDFEMMKPLFEMYRKALPLAQERTKIYFGHEGAFFPETMYFWGAYASTNYGWEREGKLASHVDNTYIRYYWSGALELIVLMLDYYAHTGDDELLANTTIPLSDAVIRFYDEHYPRDAEGELHIAPAQSLEMWQEAENPLPEVAGLTAVLEGLLALSEDQLAFEQRKRWQRLRLELPPIPLREESGQTLLAAAQKKTDVASNVENPELYAVFPYRIYGVGRPALQIGRDTYHARGMVLNAGWHQDAIQAACLGLADEAGRQVFERFSTKHTGSRFPAFWGPNYDWIPDQDHGCSAQIALQAMLLQNVGDKIHLFPAWPEEWDVDFRLHASQGTIIEGTYNAGELVRLEVQPESRRADIVVGVPARFRF
jgi:alpha-L-fucosidase 2